jgi:hypothetical protein
MAQSSLGKKQDPISKTSKLSVVGHMCGPSSEGGMWSDALGKNTRPYLEK